MISQMWYPLADVRQPKRRCAVQDFDRFRGALKVTLDNMHAALAELLPTARASGTPARSHRATCLSCEHQVRSNEEVAKVWAAEARRPGSPMRQRLEQARTPEKLPVAGGLKARRAISAAEPLGAAFNARVAAKTARAHTPKGRGDAAATCGEGLVLQSKALGSAAALQAVHIWADANDNV